MCNSNFSYVSIYGKDGRKVEGVMIVCRATDLDFKALRGIAKKHIPELFSGWFMAKLGLRDLSFFMATNCHKQVDSRFECQIGPLEKDHDWDGEPYVLLTLSRQGEKTFCSAEPVFA